MTAEIAVMNKKAVALAADSAVTVGRAGSPKVYNSANKLFGLYPHSPIGIMMYGDVGLNDVPWETLIKVYRQGGQRFDTTVEYFNHFVSYLETNASQLFDHEGQSFEVYNYTQNVILRKIRDRYCDALKIKDFPDDTSHIDKQKLTTVINDFHAIATKEPIVNGLPTDWIASLEAKYDQDFKAAFGRTLFPSVLGNPEISKIAACVWHGISSARFISRSGIVFAGFGVKEIYPTVVARNFQRVLNDRLICSDASTASVTFYRDAEIIPFAQDDGVSPIVWGRSFEYEQSIRGQVDTMMGELPAGIVEVLNQIPVSLDAKTKQALEATLMQTCEKLKGELWKKVDEYQSKYLNEQILGSLGILPKDELATVAEAMVSMTALRRKMSHDTESVGGPIDVALISKGDGFIWIKRKHYFDPSFNPQFFTRYST